MVYLYASLRSENFLRWVTDNIINRFKQHKAKESFYTKEFSEIMFVYAEQYDSKHAAAIREKQLKGWSHAKKQLLVQKKLGMNTCTEFVEDLLTRSEEAL